MKREIEIELIMDCLEKDAELQIVETTTWLNDGHTYEDDIDAVIALRNTLTEIIDYHTEYTNLIL